MNLGIEYLIRTGAIRKFFTVPCSLCLEHWQGAKLIVSIEKSFGHSSFLITHWNLEELDKDYPKTETYQIPRESVFSSEKTILGGDYSVLPYSEQPVITSYNRYSHPMDNDTYQHFLNSLLVSNAHQMEREVWLWKSFMKLHIPKPVLSLYHYERGDRAQIVMSEQKTVYDRYSKKWDVWCEWRRRLLVMRRAAPELVFYSAYN